MNAQWLLAWWNLVFIVPFGLALLYLGIYTLSGWTFGETDADVDGDADVDADADADADVDADADADAEAEANVGHHLDVGTAGDAAVTHTTNGHGGGGAASGSPLWAALSFLGVGRVPVSIVMMVLLLTWGAVGFAVNQAAREHVGEVWRVALFSLPLAALASLLVTSGTSRAIDRFMPLNMTSAKRRHELLGSTGEVILPVDARFGMASVRDADSGDLFQVPCRLETSRGEGGGGGEAIPKGARVKLVAYDARESLFYVLPDASAVAKNN